MRPNEYLNASGSVGATLEGKKIEMEADPLKAGLNKIAAELQHAISLVREGRELLNYGAKTQMVQKLEDDMNNPSRGLYAMTRKMHLATMEIVESMVTDLLMERKELIRAVYRTQGGDYDLHYCIILREDSFENREAVMEVLDLYEENELAELFPVQVQFVPEALEEKIRIQYPIISKTHDRSATSESSGA